MGGRKSKETQRAYYVKNRERILAKTKARYRANPQKYIDYALAYQKKHPEKRKVWSCKGQRASQALYREVSNAAKDAPCADCKIQYPPYVMDFDHVRGTKLFNISVAFANRYPIDKTLAEIAKCDVVCSNCHRIRTHQRGWPNGRKP